MKRAILLGGGHAHLAVLRDLARYPQQSTEFVLLTPQPKQWYSGMLPGWVAGHYSEHDCQIDLAGMAQRAGVLLQLKTAVALDADKAHVQCSDGCQLAFDILSLDIGREPRYEYPQAWQNMVLPLRPMAQFALGWERFLTKRNTRAKIIVLGAGAAGFEIALAVDHYARAHQLRWQIKLLGSELLSNFMLSVRNKAKLMLAERGVKFIAGRVSDIDSALKLDDGHDLDADLVILANGGKAPSWLAATTLTLDAEGCVLVDSLQRSVSHGNIYAAGDVAARADVHVDKSGVYAVHAGPVLSANLGRACQAKSALAVKHYYPRRRSLYILAAGNKSALAVWGRFSVAGRWVWYWKRHLDTRFIRAQHSLVY